jgi:hypothetical protein
MRFFLVLGIFLALAARAQADAILKISSGSDSVTVTDTDGDGIVAYWGRVGVFDLQVTVGTTKPFLGTALEPHMDLFNVSVSSNDGGSLTIAFTDDNFQSLLYPQMGVYSDMGGTTNGTVTATVSADDGNAHFGGSVVSSLGPFGPGPFAASATGALVGFTGSYSLTLGATITHATPGVTSFDLETVVPEPSSLALLCSAAGVIFVLRRRRS